ncbi:E3 ubiquitin-protein ligase RZF1-like [Carya illinoinensis]|uniref:E3 ubiquitin-protein ligase RZF1-like n=1 Tax=Carya illinoinensis TaxID=32201 RepID=UPI001C724F7D|nr:E3 ubiquitin-protein ligase RZF1-like [Carya illinoinensis]
MEVYIGDYSTERRLQELSEQLSVNDRQGPPPAPRSSIDAMPTIKITQAHMHTGSHCPHNSCPVCRLEMPTQGTDTDGARGNRTSGGENSGGSSRDYGSSGGVTLNSLQNQGRRNVMLP